MKNIVIVFIGIVLAAEWHGHTLAKGGTIMELKSPEFKNNGYIPKKFTCRGENINPELTVEGIPKPARSLALIVNDPDAPMGMWVHWVMFNMPADTYDIKEDSAPGKQGITDSGIIGYDGPCPPSGTHRYIFTLYALDTELSLEKGINKAALEKSMEGHILASAELIGLYKR